LCAGTAIVLPATLKLRRRVDAFCTRNWTYKPRLACFDESVTALRVNETLTPKMSDGCVVADAPDATAATTSTSATSGSRRRSITCSCS
jgi:hypothetical protein